MGGYIYILFRTPKLWKFVKPFLRENFEVYSFKIFNNVFGMEGKRYSPCKKNKNL
jgi:hypothetical protein